MSNDLIAQAGGPSLEQRFAHAATLHEQGRLKEAEAGYRQVLSLQPDQPDTLHMLGVLLIQAGRPDQGFAAIDRALALRPQYVDAHFNRAAALAVLQRFEEAVAGYDQVLALTGDHPETLFRRSLAQAQLGRLEAALAGFDRALNIAPDREDIRSARAVTLGKLGRWSEALEGFERAARRQPQDAQAWFDLGCAQKELGRLAEALASFDTALTRLPHYAQALINRGVVLKMLGRPADAVADYDRALALAPNSVEALVSRGAALCALLRIEDGIDDYDRALALEPGNALAAFNKGLALLLSGRFEQGWPLYEQRRRLPGAAGLPDQPVWDGNTPLAGKTLFLRWEQGLGDTIQFCRYASLAADQGARVILSVQNALLPLLAGFDPRVALLGEAETPPTFDLYAPLLSLPCAFARRSEPPPQVSPYLAAAPDKIAAWSRLLGAATGPRIGLAWFGGVRHENDRNRSTTLETLAPLVSGPATWIALHKERRAVDDAAWSRLPGLGFLGAEQADLSDAAALIANLDLVITVDTSLAHLSAALGKPTWILLPFEPDWRWGLSSPDTPWHPTARLFRQAAPGDWSAPLAQAAAALDEFLKPWKAAH
jgi:tetratricopeptide (TPR) repeat protein